MTEIDRFELELSSVLTMQEACIMWKISRLTLTKWVRMGKIVGRMSETGGTWLLSYSSCHTVLGEPRFFIDVEPYKVSVPWPRA